MRGWYKNSVDSPPLHARVAVATMTAERFDMYRHVPPPVQPIPVGVQPFPVNDSIPEDKDIA